MSSAERARAAYRDANPQIMRRREINKLAPVFRLVPEILSGVITHVAHDSISHHHSYRWLKVTHVCHEWREIALHAPRVWSQIYLTSNIYYLTELIARSKKAPLHVVASRAFPAPVLDLVFDMLSRIRTLDLLLDPVAPMTPTSLSAPELRCLRLAEHHSSFTGHRLCPLASLDAPKLQKLELRFFWLYVPWTSSTIFSNSIKDLRLQYFSPPDCPLDEILVALAAMPSLESLFLYGALPSLLHHSGQTIHLPCLKMLTISEKCKRCTLFLQHITHPSTTIIHIHLYSYQERNLAPFGREIATRISDSRSPDASIRSLCITNGAEDILVGWKKQLRVTEVMLDGTEGEDMVLSLPLGGTHLFESTLEQILIPLPLTSVHTLYLTPGAAFSTVWEALSNSMPNLQELGISSDGKGDEKVLNMLVVESPESASPDPPPLFPNLKVLLLSSISWYANAHDDTPGTLQLLRKMLHSRKLSQRMIEELILQDAIDLFETNLERLRGIVGNIIWDSKGVQ